MKPELSIIIPIYNVEAYIKRCAESLLEQTASPEDFEVIFVNDGTKDNSIEVLCNTVDFTKHSNFHLVEKTNGGLSSARNFGVQHSHGEYMWFVDSDDWLEPGSVEYLISKMDSKPELIVTTQMYINKEGEQYKKYAIDCEKSCTGVELMDICRPDCAVLYICNRDFWNKWAFHFYEGILHEDSEITPRILYLAQKCEAVNRPLYHYFMREESIMHVVSPKRIHSYFVVLNTLSNFYHTIVSENDKTIFAKACVPHIYGLLDVSKNATTDFKDEVNRYFATNLQLAVMMKSVPDKKAKGIGFLLGLMPSRACCIYKTFLKFQGRS